MLKDEQILQLGGDDEPQFLVQFGLIWPTYFAQTIHFLLLMHSFLGLFVLFIGRRVGILST